VRALAIAGLAVTVAAGTQPGWTPQETGVTARLRGISAVSDTVAWASGTGGTVLRTTNGGDTWAAVTAPAAADLDFRDVDAFSDRVAYVLSIGSGDASRIYKTVDGGQSWTLQLANKDPDVFLDAMAFWSEDGGIAYSDSIDGAFVIFRTLDGKTWERIPAAGLPPALEGEGAYAASGTNVAVRGEHVWIGTTASRVLHSPDRGRTWTVSQTPIATGEATGIFSIAFRDARVGIVVGGNYQKEAEAVDNAAVTSDGGRTWRLSKGLAGYRSAVAYQPGSKGTWVAAGPGGIDITEDDGVTWRPLDGAGGHAIAFSPTGRVAWITGDKGRIARRVF
jgi:photosystem II stability/assembly factor-like uncharacterized protein